VQDQGTREARTAKEVLPPLTLHNAVPWWDAGTDGGPDQTPSGLWRTLTRYAVSSLAPGPSPLLQPEQRQMTRRMPPRSHTSAWAHHRGKRRPRQPPAPVTANHQAPQQLLQSRQIMPGNAGLTIL
jgi:hypothetical protein